MEAASAEEKDNVFILNVGSVSMMFKVDHQSVTTGKGELMQRC